MLRRPRSLAVIAGCVSFSIGTQLTRQASALRPHSHSLRLATAAYWAASRRRYHRRRLRRLGCCRLRRPTFPSRLRSSQLTPSSLLQRHVSSLLAAAVGLVAAVGCCCCIADEVSPNAHFRFGEWIWSRWGTTTRHCQLAGQLNVGSVPDSIEQHSASFTRPAQTDRQTDRSRQTAHQEPHRSATYSLGALHFYRWYCCSCSLLQACDLSTVAAVVVRFRLGQSASTLHTSTTRSAFRRALSRLAASIIDPRTDFAVPWAAHPMHHSAPDHASALLPVSCRGRVRV